jgi:hypothetical protein
VCAKFTRCVFFELGHGRTLAGFLDFSSNAAPFSSGGLKSRFQARLHGDVRVQQL